MMRPLGIRPVRFPGKEDFHVKGLAKRQGYVNWWEAEMSDYENKAREKRSWKEGVAVDLREVNA
jgi:hypothetical protein